MLTRLLGLVLLGCSFGCMSQQHHLKSSALDFLYPKGSAAVAPTAVKLKLPVRVGVAFAPPQQQRGERFTETQKQTLLERMAKAFRNTEGIGDVRVIPSSYLRPGGGFENVRQLVPGFGIDIIALVSYDQFQVSESGFHSWTYWTIVGAYVIPAEKNETTTVLDAVIYDIPSQSMLFHSSGRSSSKGKSTPARLGETLRKASEADFEHATDDLIKNLNTGLDAFVKQAATGTIRGPGTPAVTMTKDGKPVKPGGRGGALGWLELALIAAALCARRLATT